MIVFCVRCWAENRPGSDRCGQCGAPLNGVESYDAALIAALHHPEPETPVRVAWILGQRRTATAVQPLREVLRQATDPYLLEAACTALGAIADTAAEPELVSILRSGPFLARRAAVGALGALGTAGARFALERAIRDDPSESVRSLARSFSRQPTNPMTRESR